MNKQVKELVNSFVKHCRDNNVYVNPYHSLYQWAEKVIEKGRCPCVPTRMSCPCPESIEEFGNEGVCKCMYFMTDKYYKNLMEKLSE